MKIFPHTAEICLWPTAAIVFQFSLLFDSLIISWVALNATVTLATSGTEWILITYKAGDWNIHEHFLLCCLVLIYLGFLFKICFYSRKKHKPLRSKGRRKGSFTVVFLMFTLLPCLSKSAETYSPWHCVSLAHIHLYVWNPLISRRIFDLKGAWAIPRGMVEVHSVCLPWEIAELYFGLLFPAPEPPKDTPGWWGARLDQSRHSVISCHKTKVVYLHVFFLLTQCEQDLHLDIWRLSALPT